MDDKTYNRVFHYDGLDSFLPEIQESMTTRYFFSLTRKPEHVMRQNLSGKCVCLTPDGLCKMHKLLRFNVMPAVCINYPRRSYDLGNISETTLELACPEAARLLLEHQGPLQMEEMKLEEPYEVNWIIGNEDEAFLKFLMDLRTALSEQIYDKPDLNKDILNQIYKMSFDIHHELLRDKLSEANNILQSFQLTDKEAADDAIDYMFYPMEIMDKVIAYNICPQVTDCNHKDLRKVIRYYFKCFDKLTDSEAREFYLRNYDVMSQEIEGLEEKYKSYYIYYLHEMLMSAYEDYHILRVILLGNMYMQIYRVLDMVAWLMAKEQGKKYDMASQSELLSNLERRMRHNLSITDGIMERIRKEFLNGNES